MTLADIHTKYPSEENCIDQLEKILWSKAPICPYCQDSYSCKGDSEHRFFCMLCKASFSVTVKTIFHDSKVDLRKWFYAINILWKEGRKISVRELGEELKVNKNTANRIVEKVKNAMISNPDLLDKITQEL